MKHLHYTISKWPLQKAFVISRGARTHAEVIQVMIEQEGKQGFAECVPYARYRESIDSVINQIKDVETDINKGCSVEELQKILPAGAARNAIDCAMWDLQAKLKQQSVGDQTGLGDPAGLISAQTISIGSVEEMANEAQAFSSYPLLKVKLDAENIISRIKTIHDHAPNSDIIIDANEAWSIDILNEHWAELAELGVVLIEQPIASENDQQLVQYEGTLPICADESCHTSEDIPDLAQRYQAINIKLDKTGGLTEAISTLHMAREFNLSVMVGCMVGTSLAMAPATLLAQHADVVDLDGPALLAEDVANGFQFNNGNMSQLNPQLWGGPK